MPQVSAAVLRSTPSSTSASESIRRAAALSFSPLAALRSSEAVRSSRVIDTAAPIDAAPLKGQHRVRVSLIWESLMSHSFGPLVSLPATGFGGDRDAIVAARRAVGMRLSEPGTGPSTRCRRHDYEGMSSTLGTAVAFASPYILQRWFVRHRCRA